MEIAVERAIGRRITVDVMCPVSSVRMQVSKMKPESTTAGCCPRKGVRNISA